MRKIYRPSFEAGAVYELQRAYVLEVQDPFDFKDNHTNEMDVGQSIKVSYPIEVAGQSIEERVNVTFYRDGFAQLRKLKVKVGQYINIIGRMTAKKGDKITFWSLVVESHKWVSKCKAI